MQKAGEASLVVPWITQAEFSRGALFRGLKNEDLAAFYSFYSSFLLLALGIRKRWIAIVTFGGVWPGREGLLIIRISGLPPARMLEIFR